MVEGVRESSQDGFNTVFETLRLVGSLIRWFYLTIRCALQSGHDVNPSTSGATLWLGIAVKVSRTGEGLLLLRPYYFRISTVRPLAFKADCYITLAPWAIRGRLAVPYGHSA